MAPYVVNGRKWFGFDDEYSIANKSQYILDMGLGGGMIWSVDTDDYKGFCGKKFGVLATMNQVLNGGPQTPPPGLSTNPILLPFLLLCSHKIRHDGFVCNAFWDEKGHIIQSKTFFIVKIKLKKKCYSDMTWACCRQVGPLRPLLRPRPLTPPLTTRRPQTLTTPTHLTAFATLWGSSRIRKTVRCTTSAL